MRWLITALIVFTLAGCVATSVQVQSALFDKYTTETVDQLVMDFGPPASRFETASGRTVYQWNLSNHTNIDVDKYGGSAQTLYCRVRATVGPNNIVESITTEDASDIFGNSICGKHLGMSRNP